MNKSKVKSKLSKTVRITVYRFEGLSEHAKQRAILDEAKYRAEEANDKDSPFFEIFDRWYKEGGESEFADELLVKHEAELIKMMHGPDEWFYFDGRRYDYALCV